MISKPKWILLRISRQLWVRAAFLSIVAVIMALTAGVVSPFIPPGLSDAVGSNSVDRILDILASSLLAVTTFSLTVMVAAYGASTSHVSPRATKLLMHDSTTQNVLATFVGAFLYSLVGIIALSAGVYDEESRLVLFIATMIVVLLIVLTILRWIHHLARLGRVSETTQRVEEVTDQALQDRVENPSLGGRPLLDEDGEQPAAAVPIFPASVGYVQHLDMARLNAWAEKHDARIDVTALPGAFVHPAKPLCRLRQVGEVPRPDDGEGPRSAFSVGDARSFDQDPRFGLSVLAEIACRALSPALNDPGTAIDVLGRAVRLLSQWRTDDGPRPEPRYSRVWVPPLDLDDLYDDTFAPIARDGASIFEVQVRLQKSLIALARLGDPKARRAARRQSVKALQQAEAALILEEEKEELRTLSRSIIPSEPPPSGAS